MSLEFALEAVNKARKPLAGVPLELALAAGVADPDGLVLTVGGLEQADSANSAVTARYRVCFKGLLKLRLRGLYPVDGDFTILFTR